MYIKRELRKKKRYVGIIKVAVIIILILLWFSDILPLKVAEVIATSYMLEQDDGKNYEVSGADYSPAHDCYFVYFVNDSSSKQRNIGIYYRYFPFVIYFDSNYPR